MALLTATCNTNSANIMITPKPVQSLNSHMQMKDIRNVESGKEPTADAKTDHSCFFVLRIQTASDQHMLPYLI